MALLMLAPMDRAASSRADGFRERGGQVTRMEAFVDAAFAFAVTLLVVSGNELPRSVAELLAAMTQVPAFAGSFGLIAMFWYAHNTWSRRYGLDDGVTVWLSLLLVFLVLVYVYPLRMLFGSFFGWMSMLLLPEDWWIPFTFAIRGYEDIRVMFIVYAVAWATMGAIIVLLYRHAWRRREALELSPHERVETLREALRWSFVPLTGVLSIVVALTVPDVERPWTLGMPGVVYFLMWLMDPVDRWYARRVRARHGLDPATR